MFEREEELRRLRGSLAAARVTQEQKEAKIEEIRVELEKIALEVVERYKRKIVALQPEGRRVMWEVVKPWFSGLVTSGTYGDLTNWAKSNDRRVPLTGAILYDWPRSALKEVEQPKAGSRAYQFTAQFIVEHSNRPLDEAIRIHTDSDEVWKAYFYLSNSKWGFQGNGVILDRDPATGMGFGAAMQRQFRRVFADASNIAGIFDTISPEVWIGFGQQIESGKVLENIENSLKFRP